MTDNATTDPLDEYAARILDRMRRLQAEADLTDEQRQTFAESNKRVQRLANLLSTNGTLGGGDMRHLTDYLTQVIERESIPVDQAQIPVLLIRVLVNASTSPVVNTQDT